MSKNNTEMTRFKYKLRLLVLRLTAPENGEGDNMNPSECNL